MRGTNFAHIVTESVAVVRYAPVLESGLITIQATKVSENIDHLGARAAETRVNVLIVEPLSPSHSTMLWNTGNELRRATQVAVDLLPWSRCGLAEAESLIEWMRSHEDTWQLVT